MFLEDNATINGLFFNAESFLLLLAIEFKYTTGLIKNSSDHGFPLLSSSRTRSPTRATYPTTTCSCPSPIPCPSPTVCPVTKCPTVTRYPVITPCPSPKPCPAVTANPSTSVCRCPAFPLADCSKCTTLTTQTITCPECSGIKAQNVILSSEDQAVSPGSFIGAALGGAVLGSSFTVIAFVCIRRRCKTFHNSKKDDQIPKSAKKTFIQYSSGNRRLKSNDSAAINSISAYYEIHDELRKSATIFPLKQQKNMSNEVYNHLHESDKEYRSDFYDHAGPAPSLSVIEDGYGVLSTSSKGSDKSSFNTLDRKACINNLGTSMTAENAESSDYFVLETHQE